MKSRPFMVFFLVLALAAWLFTGSSSPLASATGTASPRAHRPLLTDVSVQSNGGHDVYCLAYSTFLGGNGFDGGTGIALDSSGAIYVTGDVANVLYKIVPPIVALPTTLPATGHATGTGLPIQLPALAGLILIAAAIALRRWVKTSS